MTQPNILLLRLQETFSKNSDENLKMRLLVRDSEHAELIVTNPETEAESSTALIWVDQDDLNVSFAYFCTPESVIYFGELISEVKEEFSVHASYYSTDDGEVHHGLEGLVRFQQATQGSYESATKDLLRQIAVQAMMSGKIPPDLLAQAKSLLDLQQEKDESAPRGKGQAERYELELADGKYTIVLASGKEDFRFEALRYGNEWRNLAGDNLVLALVHKVQELQEAVRAAANQLEGVSLAVQQHGKNIDAAFFIKAYKEFADEARKALPKEERKQP